MCSRMIIEYEGSNMQRRQLLILGLAVLGLVSQVQAADKPDPTGTWKWSVKFNDQDREFTLKLKLDGDKLTGSMPGRNNTETNIEDATFKDGEIKFSVTRERNNNKFTTKYTGKLEGDTIKGKTESERNGQTQSRDWEAKREKA
ncbi:MAG: hypothetical protein JSS49_03000 [Planctomycetes bacterium]|nr:hypothetical protein [Planctomycetota bacterium]